MGVRRVAVPIPTAKAASGENFRKRVGSGRTALATGCEGRISVLKRRHGLNRCRYRGFEGMQRWVGLG